MAFKIQMGRNKALTRFVTSQLYVWVAVLGVVYVAGLALVPKQIRQEKELALHSKEGKSLDSSESLRYQSTQSKAY